MEKNIAVEAVRTTIVPVRSFNRTLARSANKATATFSLIRTLLEESWSMSPPDVDIRSNVLRAIRPNHNPTQNTLNRLLKPLGLKLSVAPIGPVNDLEAA